MIFYLVETLGILLVAGALFFSLGIGWGWLTWGRLKKSATEWRNNCDRLNARIATLEDEADRAETIRHEIEVEKLEQVPEKQGAAVDAGGRRHQRAGQRLPLVQGLIQERHIPERRLLPGGELDLNAESAERYVLSIDCESHMERETTRMAAITEAAGLMSNAMESADLHRRVTTSAGMILEAEHAVLRLVDDAGGGGSQRRVWLYQRYRACPNDQPAAQFHHKLEIDWLRGCGTHLHR